MIRNYKLSVQVLLIFGSPLSTSLRFCHCLFLIFISNCSLVFSNFFHEVRGAQKFKSDSVWFFGEDLFFPIFGIRIIQSFIQGVARPMPKESNSQWWISYTSMNLIFCMRLEMIRYNNISQCILKSLVRHTWAC